MPILGELKLPDSTVQLLRLDGRKKEFDGIYCAGQHLLHLDVDHHGPSFGHVPRSGRYADDDQPLAGIGAVVFRPAGFRVEARGLAPSYRLQCWLGDGPLDIVRSAVPDWRHEHLARTLDIRARSVGAYMARLANEVARPGFVSSMTADALLVLALSDIAAFIAGEQPDTAKSRGDVRSAEAADRALKRVVERVCDLADVTPALKDLAQAAGMNERRLLRLFRNTFGISLPAFVKDMRLKRAQHYLSFTDMSLTEISDRLGFSSQPNFATAFRRETHVTPREYRRESRPRLIGARNRGRR